MCIEFLKDNFRISACLFVRLTENHTVRCRSATNFTYHRVLHGPKIGDRFRYLYIYLFIYIYIFRNIHDFIEICLIYRLCFIFENIWDFQVVKFYNMKINVELSNNNYIITK